jgi:hypothetical protein
MTPRCDLVKKAIRFQSPERIPILFLNRDQFEGDILMRGMGLDLDGQNEWGYHLENLGDGTMGQPKNPILADWAALDTYRFPAVNAERRMAGVESFIAEAGDRYLLAGLGITGFNLYTFLRGFQNALLDFVVERENAERLLDGIVAFEMELTTLAARAGLHGVHFADDWGSQDNLLIAPDLWRDLFKPLYRRQFDHAHRLGLDVWVHSCGRIESIVDDFHELGVDVMNISQPNTNDLDDIGRRLRGRQCFMEPISYQTVSISGSPAQIHAEARRMHAALGAPTGGFIGYVEEYTCMGMSEENYQACIAAFRTLDAAGDFS